MAKIASRIKTSKFNFFYKISAVFVIIYEWRNVLRLYIVRYQNTSTRFIFRMMKKCDTLLKLSGITSPNQSPHVRTLFFWGGSYPLTQKDRDAELSKARAPIKIKNPPSSNELVATKPGIFIPGMYICTYVHIVRICTSIL